MSLRIYGNRLIKTLPGPVTRPTLAKVRQAVFNIWQGTIEGAHWLDLCAGSGVMGAEALCRGAAQVIGIEQSGPACAVIQANWQQLAQPGQEQRVLRGDVIKRLKILKGQQFDRIYFDPPYDSDLYAPVLEMIGQYQLLAPHGEIAVEHRAHGWDLKPAGFVACRVKRYGHSALTFYRADASLNPIQTVSLANEM